MATLVLSAVGAQIGASVGGGVLGLSSAVIGRAVGATVGQLIDQRILGQGGQVVEQGRVERFRLNGASEGSGIPQVFGRMRVSGQIIWASRFLERVKKEDVGGKGGGGGGTTVKEYSYSVSLAVALCEGEVARVGRVWADGNEISASDYNMRVYQGDQTQLPDPKIEAVEGAGNAPSYRGVAYVVFEDLQLGDFGNRVPQFSFEVVRRAPEGHDANLADHVRATALVPGTGEYSLATDKIYLPGGRGSKRPANVNTPLGVPDFTASVDTMRAELPRHNATSLVVSWFGTDLRCGSCEIAPRVEYHGSDPGKMPWRVSGLSRSGAQLVPFDDDERPIYGGTPTDQSVKQAIAELRSGGREAMFYPFVLMTQMPGNALTDPYTGAPDQPVLPWRGRITASIAPGQPGSPDQTATVDAEVAAFFGTAQPGDFNATSSTVNYSGPTEFSYRRFILHYAHLCASAGGVDSFCIGSELRGLTWLRGAAGFPAVDALKQLAADVKTILPTTKIGYAADWTEFANYRPDDGSNDVFFHLDPLWADPNIDFVGIDNYAPLADWRDGDTHADAHHGSIHDLDYLQSNVQGGEGYDWYYASQAARDAQSRTPITDNRPRRRLGLPRQGPRRLVAESAPRPPRRHPLRNANRLGPGLETHLVHGSRLPRRRQGRQRAQPLPRPQVVRIRAPAVLLGPPRRHDAAPGPPRRPHVLGRPSQQPRLTHLQRTHGRSRPRLRLGLGRAPLSMVPERPRHLVGRSELQARPLAQWPQLGPRARFGRTGSLRPFGRCRD